MKTFLLSIFCFLFSISYAQEYQAGESYFGSNDYIEYKAGNLPIIISAPHGGILEPEEIPNRNCSGCVYVRDADTEDLIRRMYDAIFEELGAYPHVIINRLHRRKLDANRDIRDAADGNAVAEQAWNDFQNFIELAKDSVETRCGKGLYLDLHGHGHEIQRLELGYRISKSELQLEDIELNAMIYVDDSSLKNLVQNNLNDLTLSQLLRGADSFGELYEQEFFPSVPSQKDPYPFSDDSYFSGGYNTERHGSKLGGHIDGIQIECNRTGVRDTPENREKFAKATAKVLKRYLEKHYFGSDFFNNPCGMPTSIEHIGKESFTVKISPNPIENQLNLSFHNLASEKIQLFIFNAVGQLLYQSKNTDPNSIPSIHLSNFTTGLYFLQIHQKGLSKTIKFVK